MPTTTDCASERSTKPGEGRRLQDPYAPLDPDRFYSVVDVAERAGLSRSRAYMAFHEEEEKRRGLPHLRSVHVGSSRRIRGTWLKEFLDSLARGRG